MTNLASQYDDFDEEFRKGTLKYNKKSRAAYYPFLDDIVAGAKILDVACGDGYDIQRFRALGAECYGIDSAENMIVHARKRMPDVEFVCGDMTTLPYKDESFDHIVSKYAVQTAWDAQKVIGEMDRVLKVGGTITYLVTHPFRQFMEKKKSPKNYFKKEIVESTFFEGAVTALEPSHTMMEYLDSAWLKRYHTTDYGEYEDFPSAEQINGDIYPCFMVLQATKLENA